MQKYVNRPNYLDFLKRSANLNLIKVITGVRRSGKSTLFKLFQEYLIKEQGIAEDQFVMVNFEDFLFDDLKDPKLLHQYVLDHLSPNKMTYVFLDEIQEVNDFERVVDSLYLRDKIDLYLTGSNAYFLSGELSTMLTGRFIELDILPLSFKEFFEWYQINDYQYSITELFELYQKSSFPQTLGMIDEQIRLDYLQGLYSTLVLDDIVKRLSIKNVRVLERVIKTIFSSMGSLITVNKLKNTLNSKGTSVSGATIDRFIAGMIDSKLLYETPRYDVHGLELLDTQEKYYVVDIGLRNMILRDHVEDFGHILENIVYLELLRRGNQVYVGKSKKYEVDFVAINAKQELEYYQVSQTTLDEDVLKRELNPLAMINDQYPKYLLTMDEIVREANYNGIKKLNVLDWLLQ